MDQAAPGMLEAWARHLGVPPEELDPTELRSRLTRGSIPALLAEAASEHPSSTLAVDSDRVTLAELHGIVARRAAALAEHGVAAGDRVLISAPGSLELVITYLAALHAGAVVVLANPAYTRHELATALSRSGAALLVTADPGVQVADLGRSCSLQALAHRAEAVTPHPGTAVRSDSVALLAFTSGTTATPKAVPLTHGHLLSSIRAAMWAWHWNSSDTLVHALPLFHQHGLSGVHATLVAGSSASILSRFDPEALVDMVKRERATVLFGVPSIHRRLLQLGTDHLKPLRNLRLVTSGSAPLPAVLADEFQAATGISLLERYGLTETGLNLSNPYAGHRVPGRVGTPLPGVEVALTDDNGTVVERHGEGEIVLRGPQVFGGYLNAPEDTAAAFLPGGWFRTGDLGRWDEQGRLQISGRLKDLVITGGMNVAPGEVEAVVEQLADVGEAAVAGLPSDRWGEEVAVWVVPSRGSVPDAERLIAHCREHLAAYKCPKRVFVVDELPRNPMGKIMRSRLADQIQ